MSKVKAVLVVLLLVGGGGAGAFFGLNNFYQARLDAQTQSALAGAGEQFVDHLRVRAFMAIQRLSRERKNPELSQALSGVRPLAEDTTLEAAKKSLQATHQNLLPVLEKLHKKTKSVQLFALSTDGRVVAGLPDRDRFGDNLAGLPAIKECLAGVSRDGFYELGRQPLAIAVTPVLNDRGQPSGCLMSADPLDASDFAGLAKQAGLEAALFLRNRIVAATMDRNALKPLIAKVGSDDIIHFGDVADAPLLTDLAGKGYAARSVTLQGGTDPMHLAMILPLSSLVAPLKDAQMTLFMGVGALLIVGLLLGFLLSARSDTREAERLRDAVRNLSDGSTSVLSVSGYSGVYQDLADSIGKLASSGPRPAPAMSGNGLGFQSPLDSEPPEAPEPGDLDFERLLGGASKSAGGAPDPAAPKSPPPAPAPAPAPAATADSELPAELFAPAPAEKKPAAPAPEPPVLEPEPEKPAPAAAEPPASGGPRVELPGELAGMFDEQTVEASASPPAMPEPAPAQPTPPAPPSAPPGPPDLGEDQEQIKSSDYRPDATVIAQVPDELLKAAFTMEQQNAAGAAPGEAAASSPIRPVEESPEDSHFRDVFQQFVDTKKQCGESTVGLTFDRFAEKLRKNTADLKSRYKCRTVKFHVYVKNGKAALKATPLK